MSELDVIPWGAPVPSFGDLSRAKVATLGLNPSNREFVDDAGTELAGPQRRFHTLSSLGLASWSEVDAGHLRLILDSCCAYFQGNPYDRWFKSLDRVLAGTNASYYSSYESACHLDLIPYATSRKWTDLTPRQRSQLLQISADALALLLRDSPVELLILNGNSVVRQFQELTGTPLERYECNQWTLYHREHDIPGFGYKGIVDSLCEVDLRRALLVLGYNHNIQSSFGVTTQVVVAIRDWIAQHAAEVMGETSR